METTPLPLVPRKRLVALAKKRIKRFAVHFSRLSTTDDPDAIHDVRVWSRRLQQILNLLFQKPQPAKIKKLIRTPKKVRRQLGDCRDLDISMRLIKERIESSDDDNHRRACEEFQKYLRHQRDLKINSARKKLARHDITGYVAKCQQSFNDLVREPDLAAHRYLLCESVKRAARQWDTGLTRACQQPVPALIHGLRIAAKRLRYRAELLAELGDTNAKDLVQAIKTLQQELGDWHDRYVYLRFLAEFTGRPEFLMDSPELARNLLVEIESERDWNNGAIERILETAKQLRQAGADSIGEIAKG